MQQLTKSSPPSRGLPANGILCLYNQFPRCYENIYQMTLQLPEIAAMGFNAVWINPIQETGKLKHPLGQDPLKVGKNKAAYSGSLYAIKDPEKIDDAFSTDKFHNSKRNKHDSLALQNYTKIAKEHGIAPIFDLVLNHVALDAEAYIQHPEWFIHPSVHFGNFCCDFNYKNPKLRAEIMAFQKEEIRKYIVDYGFIGVRIDAAKHLPLDVQKEIYTHINELCSVHHKIKPIIYAEIIAGEKELSGLCTSMQSLGITHVMNSLFQERFTKDYREADSNGRGFWEKSPKGGKDVLYGLSLLRSIVYGGASPSLGGTISFSGSHDESSLYEAALSDQARSLVEKENGYALYVEGFKDKCDAKIAELSKLSLEQQASFLKEKIAAIAFTSDGGWYLLSGDEFGHSGRKWVFDFYNPCENGKYSFQNKWGGQFDLRDYIKNINQILANLPAPDPEYWAQHVVLIKKSDLMIIVRHNGKGFEKTAELVVVNLSNNPVILSFEDVREIAKIVSLRSQDSAGKIKANDCIMNAMKEGKIFCVGDIKIENLVPIKNVIIANDRFLPPDLLNHFIQIANQNPLNPIVHYNLGNAALAQRNIDLARNAFLSSFELFKQDFSSSYNQLPTLAKSLYLVECHPQAFECFAQLVQLEPRNPDIHYHLGQTALLTERKNVAQRELLAAYKLFLQTPPENPLILHSLADSLYKCGIPKESFECSLLSVKLFPNDPISHYSVGQAALQTGNIQMAGPAFLTSCRLSLANPQTSPQQFYMLAGALTQIGCLPQALECYGRIAALEPRNPIAHYNVGMAALALGQRDLAQQALLISFREFKANPLPDISLLERLEYSFNITGLKKEAGECQQRLQYYRGQQPSTMQSPSVDSGDPSEPIIRRRPP